MSSLGPGVSGAETSQSARNKSTYFGKILEQRSMIALDLFVSRIVGRESHVS